MSTLQPTYRASTTITIAPQNVASSSTFVAGVESDAYDNSGNKDVDVLVAGQWKSGGVGSTGLQLQVWVIAARDDSPTWPDVFDGTSSAETVTSANVLAGFGKLAQVVNLDTGVGTYNIGPFSVAQLFGGVMPSKFVLFLTHNSGVASDTTAGNHVWKATGVSYTVN